MTEILDLATRLGKAIASSPQGQAVKAAIGLLHADPSAMDIMRKLDEQAEKISRLEQENKPVEVGDKHALRDLQDQLARNSLLKKFSETQMEYVDLVRRVNERIQTELAEVEGPPEAM